MNKLELIQTLKDEADISKPEAAKFVEIFFGEMAKALKKGDWVEIRGLCSFYVKKYKSYVGRNPKSGEKVKIKPKKLPFFKCGRELKDRMNNNRKLISHALRMDEMILFSAGSIRPGRCDGW